MYAQLSPESHAYRELRLDVGVSNYICRFGMLTAISDVGEDVDMAIQRLVSSAPSVSIEFTQMISCKLRIGTRTVRGTTLLFRISMAVDSRIQYWYSLHRRSRQDCPKGHR
jgi:hypothetical protein